MATLEEVYAFEDDDSYQVLIVRLYNVNKKLRNVGIHAPSETAVASVAALYASLSSPLDAIPTFHIGGTNGKGSTSFKIAYSLASLGYRCGLFVSPHIACFRERMQINNNLISEVEFCSLLKQIFRLCQQQQLQATEFEIAFLMACLHFKNNGCDAVVLEVGVGGIHDATNVVKTCVSVICSVSLDHTRILGNSVDLICEKKAGIFKTGTPALIGPDVPLISASRIATENNAIFTDFTMACTDFQPFLLIHGLNEVWEDTDDLNSMLSLFALCLASRYCPAFIPTLLPQLSDARLTTALRARPSCRWEKHVIGEGKGKIEFVLDMGHNPAALQQLVRRTQRDYPSDQYIIRIVLGISRDKDVRSCICSVMAVAPVDHFHFVQAKYFRAMSSVDLSTILAEESGTAIPTELVISGGDDIAAVLSNAKALCQEEAQLKGCQSVVIVCGSGYIMPDARSFLGIIEPRDHVQHL